MNNYKALAGTVSRILVRFLACLGALVLLVCATPLASWWATRLAGPWDDPKGDVLVVLGGSLLDPGLLGINSYWRSIYALQAWRSGGFHDIVITGGSDPQSPIALLMADFLKCQGVPASAIHIETRSNTTYENAIYSKPILDRFPGTKVLLTSDYHMFRAHKVFEKAGIHVLPRPFPDARKRGTSWLGRWQAFYDVVIETVKIGYYRWNNWI
jgi:uncharacterized SAM-binding protein YcdF (DUF218 family)